MRRSAGLALVICGALAAQAQAADRRSSRLKLAPVPAAPAVLDAGSLDALFAKADPGVDAAALRWRSTAVQVAPQAKLRIRLTEPTPALHAREQALAERRGDYEVALVRDWPAAVSFRSGAYGVDVSPHAAVGMTRYGGLAEAGATVELGKKAEKVALASLDALGVSDGERFGDAGRWYLFAAASGRAVGLNMLHEEGGLARAGWTTDKSSTLVGDAQVGVGWRKGPMQTSVGLLHREIKGEHTWFGVQPKADTMLAVSFAVRPRK